MSHPSFFYHYSNLNIQAADSSNGAVGLFTKLHGVTYQKTRDADRCENIKSEYIIITSIVYLFLYVRNFTCCVVELASKELSASCAERSKREVLYGELDAFQ